MSDIFFASRELIMFSAYENIRTRFSKPYNFHQENTSNHQAQYSVFLIMFNGLGINFKGSTRQMQSLSRVLPLFYLFWTKILSIICVPLFIPQE